MVKSDTASFKNSALKIRNLIRRYETSSLLNELISYMQATPRFRIEGKLYAPWVPLLAIDWTLELHSQSGAIIADKKVAMKIMNKIWNVQHFAVSGQNKPFNLQLRALLIPQLIFQSEHSSLLYSFIRHISIFKSDQKGYEELKVSFFSEFGIDFDRFFEVCFFISIINFREKFDSIDYGGLVKWLFPKFSIEEIALSVKIVGNRLSELIVNSQKQVDRDVLDSEYFEQSPLFDKPLIISSKKIIIPHPTLLMCGLTQSITRAYLRRDQKNRVIFTRCFEEYVNKLHLDLGYKYLREIEILDFYKNNKVVNRKVADFILKTNNGSIFLDAKGVEPNKSVLAATTRYSIGRRVKDHHLKAINQIIETIDVLRSYSYDGLDPIENRYGLVVTHQDFYLSTGERIWEYLGESEKMSIDNSALDNILLKNIHFMSIEQYEKLLCLCGDDNGMIVDFLEYVSLMESNPNTARIIMNQHIEEFFIKNLGFDYIPNCCVFVTKERDAQFSNIENFTKENNDYWRKVGLQGDYGVGHFYNIEKQLRAMLSKI